jgi:SOS-response transcriptional repressor LexA
MKILNALNADVQEFLQETGYIPVNVEPASLKKLRPIPVISWVMAGKWNEVCDSFQPGDADEWIESDVRGRHVFALRVKGDSMEPEFKEGEIVIVNPHLETKPGGYVIVKNDDSGEATFKQLKKYGETTVLHPLNPKYPDIELKKGTKYRVVGKIVEKKKKY